MPLPFPGAFEQALAGVRAWMEEGGAQCDVDVALTMRQRSIDTLVSEVEELAREIPSAAQIVIAIDPARASERTGSTRAAVAAFAEWNDDQTRPLLAWEGLLASHRRVHV